MKKTLIALAALAATGAFAQSSVTISGTIDAGIKGVASQTHGKSNTSIAGNNTSTSAVIFAGTEDIGGGMKASFSVELDPNIVSNSTANTSAPQYTGTPFNGQSFLGLAGNFGDLKLGSPNSSMMTTSGLSQPFGTALGSGYSAGFGRLSTASNLGVNQYVGGASSNGRIVRHEKTAMYTTPTMNGFKASVEYSFGNDNSQTTATDNSNLYSALGLSYSNGPLNIGYAYTNIKAGVNAVAASATAAGAVTNSSLVNGDITYNMLAANYAFGATTVYAGYTTSKHNATTVLDETVSWNLAVKYALSANVDLMANYVNRDDRFNTGTAEADAKMVGLGVDYKLSKRTAAYVRYETLDTNTAVGTTGEVNTWAAGLRHTF